MIQIIQNVITDNEIKELINYYNENIKNIVTSNDHVYRFNGISIIDNLKNFSFTKKLNYNNFDRIRIQHVDSNIEMIELAHTHVTPYCFVIFLNDEFDGGELIFDNIIFKPKIGQLVYFTGNESHFVNNVLSGNRYTLIGFCEDGGIDLKKLKSQII